VIDPYRGGSGPATVTYVEMNTDPLGNEYSLSSEVDQVDLSQGAVQGPTRRARCASQYHGPGDEAPARSLWSGAVESKSPALRCDVRIIAASS
jgi:hypothetical protein